jgi:hypothetical protein
MIRYRLPNWILLVGAFICVGEIRNAPRDSDPGPWLTAAFGLLLIRRGILATRQPSAVIISGCLITVLTVAGNHGFLNINRPVWTVILLLLFACYAFWERFVKIWKPKADEPQLSR